MQNVRSATFLLFVLTTCAVLGFAQSQITTGVIQGTVTDAQGAVVSGASVEIKNADTNLTKTLTTDDNGRFAGLLLPPGRYTVTITKQGFGRLIQENVNLTVGQSINLSPSLKVAGVEERIVVTDTPTIETVKTESSSTLNRTTVETTPVLGRKFEDLLTLTPGVAIVQGPDGDEITFNGQRGIFTNVSLDGGDYQNGFFGEQLGGQRAAIDISMEAVQEFQVTAAGASAEFGRSAGGVVNVITKSGTNEFHGSLFHYQRLEALTSNTSDGKPLTDFHREQTGFTIGGPIVKDKHFFFGNGEFVGANLQRDNLSAQVGTTACPMTSGFDISNPAHETMIVGNGDCQRLALLEYWDTALGVDEGQAVRRPTHTYNLLGKWDWNISENHRSNASYNFTTSRKVNETFDVATFGSSANGIEGTAKIHVFNWNLSSTFSPTVLNEAHFGYTREDRPRASLDTPITPDVAISADGTARAEGLSFRFGHPFFLQPNVDELFWRTQIRDNVSIVKGKHNIKFGGEWIHSLNDQVFRGFFQSRHIFDSVAGFLRYTADPLLGPGFGPTTGECAADAAGTRSGVYDDLVVPSGACGAFGFVNNPFTFGPGPLVLFLQGAGRDGLATDAAGASNITNEDFAFFIQDKWQITPYFTLNLGFRWEAQLFPDPVVSPSDTVYAPFLSDPRFPSDGTLPSDKKMIQPRIGFAWDVAKNGKSLIRASWGIYNARQNMLSQVGSITTNGVQQQTLFQNSAINGFGAPPPLNCTVTPCVPGVLTPAPLPPGTFNLFTGVRVFDRNYRNPRVYTGNVAFEQELAPNWAAYVDFTWSKGVYLTNFLNYNRADRGAPFAPILDETAVTSSRANSLYRGVTFGVRKRFSKGFQMDSNYTYAVDYDNDSNERDPFTDRSARVFPDTADPFDLRRDYSYSDRDIRHRFNFVLFAQLPGKLEVNTRMQARSSQPITPAVRFIPATVGVPCTTEATCIDLGRNSERKDNAYFSLDWRVQRPFKIGERFAVVPIFEMFNTFNNENNVNPLTTPSFFNFDGFLRQGVGDPRQAQLAVKLTW